MPSRRPNPRLRPEGAAYAERNRGTMERWFDYSDTGSGKANGTSGADHVGTQAPWAETERPAVDVQDPTPIDPSMTRSQGGGESPEADVSGEAGMQDLMEKSSELSLSSVRGPAEEAKEYAERNRGSMEHIINNYKVTTPPQSPGAREPPSSQTQGTETAPSPPSDPCQSPRQRTLHQESQGRTWDETRPAPRIRPDGESIAMKNSTDSMFGIMRSDNSPQDSPVKAAPHAARHAQESATEPDSASQPRARPGEGRRNYERAHDQSEMAAILRGEGDSSRAAPARNIRHLQRSELW